MDAPLVAALLVLGALLACKSKSNVTGSVSFNGAAFETTDCQVSESTSSLGGGSVTTHTVTLVDAAKRRLSFSDSGGMRVSYFAGGNFDTIGSGCGKMSFVGSVKSGGVSGHVEADCTGSGHVVRANFDFAGCGQYGFGP
ncbi:MAG: hypothetical protein HS104_37145 [Polyangiaceae bacterium]|nr:hypothetical protein [Polyangiaceae bacterium]MCL4751055.1 hypothetical protein [Myxococcales bacterium]